MDKTLEGKHVALVATDGFEQSELFEPLRALQDAGADVDIISLRAGEIKGWQKGNWGKPIKVDVTVDQADAENYDALLLPGGVMNPDKLRDDENVVQFVQKFVDAGKPIAAICHGPQTLIETGMLRGRKMTSYHSLRTDMFNAGADWMDTEVVVDNGLVTSRKPDDIPAFNAKMIEVFAAGSVDISLLGSSSKENDQPRTTH
ncbi:MAG TPA: type 1 glutamine amidotransferase domain-containing protein [Bdellovibrio sp.]|uniref:type 1 glutamine amidotransferase domain-containing protein n=1 Tax=Bdellovibrio sp. TaxID=28201 RepID=UPI002EF6B81E